MSSTNTTVSTDEPSTAVTPSSTTIDTTSSFIPSSSTTTSISPSRTTTTSSSPSPSPSSTTTTSPSPSPTTTSSIAPSTSLTTSVVTESSSSTTPVVVFSTVTSEASVTSSSPTSSSTSSAPASSSSSAASLQNAGSNNGSGGLSTGGKTAIAVVVPVVAVALLVLAALFFWRKRKQRKQAEEARRKEVEDYGYNPNSGQPTLPALASDGQSEMAEDSTGGYRGWGAGKSSRGNPSTVVSGGTHTQRQPSDSGSNNGNLSSSPTAFGGSDGRSSDLAKNRDTMNSDDLASLGVAPAAADNRGDMRRGPSNASSTYSAGHVSEGSDQGLGHSMTNDGQGYLYGQHGPYGDGSYGGGDGMPVVRDVSARRNTRIEQGGTYQQGNSGIAQNF